MPVPHALTRRHTRGFSLIELMTVVLIVAVLSAIALPSYNGYVARARRAEARTALLQAAQFMQRFHAANDRFDEDRAGNPVTAVMPQPVRVSPPDGTSLYQLNPAITTPGSYTAAVSATAYTLTMAPISGRSMAQDACGRYTLTSEGLRGNLGAGGSPLPTSQRDECWK